MGEAFRILFPRATKPDNMLVGRRSFLRQYGAFLRSMSQPTRRSEWAALEDMRAEFLRRAPDFIDFTQMDGVYYEGERVYKDAIRDRILQIVASDADDVEAGKQVARALIPADGPLLQWQGLQTIESSGDENRASFHRAIGRCARDPGDASAALLALVADLQRLSDAAELGLTKGVILNIALTVSGFVRPDFSAPFKITKARQLTDDRSLNPTFIRCWPIARLGMLRQFSSSIRGRASNAQWISFGFPERLGLSSSWRFQLEGPATMRP